MAVVLLRLTVRALERVALPPFKGSMLRGGFGHAFKERACVQRRGPGATGSACPRCVFPRICPFAQVFETSAPPGAPKRFADAPRPFALKVRLDPRSELKPGERIEFGLALIGRGIDYLPYFVYGFERLAQRGLGPRRGRCLLERVEATDGLAASTVFQAGGGTIQAELRPRTLEDFVRPGAGDRWRLQIDLETPLRLEADGEVQPDLCFPDFARALLRRIALLRLFHCAGGLSREAPDQLLAGADLVEVRRTLRWYDWQRFSSRQQAWMDMGWLVGSLVVEGRPGALLPYLRVGELVNVGKNATFGLGSYRLKATLAPGAPG